MNDPIETVEYDDIPDDASELEPPDASKYRTLLEIWRSVLEPAAKGPMRNDPISPQWATKMVTTYPGVAFKDVVSIHHGFFDLATELAQILEDEIATDEKCLQHLSAEEDRTENAEHYKNLLAGWQVHLLIEELSWHPSDPDAATKLAVLSEVQQMFLGQNGLVAHLDSIGFQFTEEDQEALQQTLMDARAQALGLDVEGEDE